MDRGQWVQASNVAKEGVSAALNYMHVFNMREAGVAGYLSIFLFFEPAHSE